MVMDSPYGDWTLLQPGFPIRISRDLSYFAAPPSVSPLHASFIGTLPQGIHQTPFVAYKLLIQKPMLLKERSFLAARYDMYTKLTKTRKG